MRVDYYCSKCEGRNRVHVEGFPANVECGACGQAFGWEGSEVICRDQIVDVCVVCGGETFYIEKDFPRRVGYLVIAGAIVAFLVTENLFWLLGAAGIDFVLWLVLPERTVCYRCLADYRGFRVNPTHQRYDLTVAARFSHRS